MELGRVSRAPVGCHGGGGHGSGCHGGLGDATPPHFCFSQAGLEEWATALLDRCNTEHAQQVHLEGKTDCMCRGLGAMARVTPQWTDMK